MILACFIHRLRHVSFFDVDQGENERVRGMQGGLASLMKKVSKMASGLAKKAGTVCSTRATTAGAIFFVRVGLAKTFVTHPASHDHEPSHDVVPSPKS